MRYLETGRTPQDAQQVDHTWLHVTKSGQPDRRYRDNPALPVMQYATLHFTSASGLNEKYMVSNPAAAAAFAQAYQRFKVALAAE
jgi:DNA polymerase-3 subunit epsilon